MGNGNGAGVPMGTGGQGFDVVSGSGNGQVGNLCLLCRGERFHQLKTKAGGGLRFSNMVKVSFADLVPAHDTFSKDRLCLWLPNSIELGSETDVAAT